MDFVLWASHVMHVVSIVVWFGGLIFINVVLLPVLHHEGMSRSKPTVVMLRRFSGFIWSSLWSALITGLLLMILSPRFKWFDFSTTWLRLLGIKELVFVLLVFITWQTSRVVGELEKAVEEDEVFERWRLTCIRLIRRAIALGILSLLCTGAMAIV